MSKRKTMFMFAGIAFLLPDPRPVATETPRFVIYQVTASQALQTRSFDHPAVETASIEGRRASPPPATPRRGERFR